MPAAVVSMGRNLVERVGRDQHGFVAGHRGLRGQCVHRLGARYARHQLHGEGGDAPGLQGAHEVVARVRPA